VVVWRGEYLPFGEVFNEDKDPDADGVDVQQPLRFPGQYEDQETGLYYNYFRDYDPALGRYVEADPIGLAGGMNIYGYASASPVIGRDKYGLTGLEGILTLPKPIIIPVPPVILGPAILVPAVIYWSTGGDLTQEWISAGDEVFWGDSTYDDADEPTCDDGDDDICYQRWVQEHTECFQFQSLGWREVDACQKRAATRRDLCIRNGGRPMPGEPRKYWP